MIGITRSIFFFALLSLAACQRSHVPKLSPHPFQFEASKVSELTLLVKRPETSEILQARLLKNFSKSLPGKAPVWEITNSNDGVLLQDQLANGNLVEHILDLLTTFTLVGPAAHGPASSFGLESPRYLIQWHLKDSSETFELKIGDVEKDSRNCYALVRSGALEASQRDQIWKTNGSVLQLLEHLRSFDDIRLAKLVPEKEESLAKIEIKGKSLYGTAERQGSRWVASHLKWSNEKLTHFIKTVDSLEIENFHDSSQNRLNPQENPDLWIRLSPFKGESTELWIVKNQGKYWARVSTRKNALFELVERQAQTLFH